MFWLCDDDFLWKHPAGSPMLPWANLTSSGEENLTTLITPDVTRDGTNLFISTKMLIACCSPLPRDVFTSRPLGGSITPVVQNISLWMSPSFCWPLKDGAEGKVCHHLSLWNKSCCLSGWQYKGLIKFGSFIYSSYFNKTKQIITVLWNGTCNNPVWCVLPWRSVQVHFYGK